METVLATRLSLVLLPLFHRVIFLKMMIMIMELWMMENNDNDDHDVNLFVSTVPVLLVPVLSSM